MVLQILDWKFEVDMLHTMEYSTAEAAAHCTCGYCRNFYEAVDAHCPELRPFLAQFGLDITAPEVLYPYDIGPDMWYEGEYVVFGRILQQGQSRIRVGTAWMWPMAEREDSQLDQPHFILSLEELELPWILDEPLRDVVSTANEPSFLKRMWNRLLGRGKDSQFHS